MMRRRSYKKQNRGGHPEKRFGLWDMAGIGCMALILASAEPFLLSAQAEPATLKSPDATVYEQPGEGSNPVGNLVEGGSFEYTGDVTAEDGSVWHQITTAGGVNGYIRGDREIEMGAAQEPVPEDQVPVAGEDGTGEPPADNPPEGNEEGEGNPAQETGGENEVPPENDNSEEPGEESLEEVQEEEESPEDGTEGDLEEAVPVLNMRNNQAKKYVVDTSQKVKERGSLTEIKVGVEAGKSTGARIDKTLAASIMVVLLCGGMIHICWMQMKRMRKGTSEGSISVADGSRNRSHRKAERKKHSQKRKSSKIVQGKKRI